MARRKTESRRQALRTAIILIVAFSFGAAIRILAAAKPGVLVVSADSNAAHVEAVTAMQTELGGRATFQNRTLTDSAPLIAESTLAPAVVVTVGTEAAARVFGDRPGFPVYAALLPEASFHALSTGRGDTASATVSGLYLDQPFGRQMQLIRLAMPAARRIGIVLGPDSLRHVPALKRAAATAGFNVNTETIGSERQLVGALHRVLEDADILLAVPDPLVFNRHTAQSVLRIAHGRGKPVAGYSRAYVSAGALLAVYSTPEQIGRHAGESLLQFLDNGRLPPPQSPRYFSVAVNETVAHAMGLRVPDEKQLTDQLKAGESGRGVRP